MTKSQREALGWIMVYGGGLTACVAMLASLVLVLEFLFPGGPR